MTQSTLPTTVRDAVIIGLAEAMGRSIAEVEDAIAAAGGEDRLELDSKTAEWIIVHVETRLGTGKLPTPADLGQDQIATVGALIESISGAIDRTSRS